MSAPARFCRLGKRKHLRHVPRSCWSIRVRVSASSKSTLEAAVSPRWTKSSSAAFVLARLIFGVPPGAQPARRLSAMPLGLHRIAQPEWMPSRSQSAGRNSPRRRVPLRRSFARGHASQPRSPPALPHLTFSHALRSSSISLTSTLGAFVRSGGTAGSTSERGTGLMSRLEVRLLVDTCDGARLRAASQISVRTARRMTPTPPAPRHHRDRKRRARRARVQRGVHGVESCSASHRFVILGWGLFVG